MMIRREVALVSSFVLAVLAVACTGQKVAEVDASNGGVQGSLAPARGGMRMVLCRIDEAEGRSCRVRAALADVTNSNGSFTMSRVPPGSYAICHAAQSSAVIKDGDMLSFSFGLGSGELTAKMQDDKWVTDADLASDTNVLKKGAEVTMGGSGLTVQNGSVEYLPSRLSMEFREGHRFESVTVKANEVTRVQLRAWGL
jgi:hypothetical protein